MKGKPQLTVALAILAFVLSAITGVFVSHRIKKSHVQTTSTVPASPQEGPADWEAAFFSALEERTKKVGLPSLRTKQFADGDVELRLWYDARPDIINGIVIGRYRDSWSAFGLRQERNRWPSELKQEDLGVPRSGWNALWKQLTDAGVLVLPDSEKINCSGNSLDGVIYVTEVRAEQKYRTYRYDNPAWADCDEAKRILAIEGLIADEFNIRVPDPAHELRHRRKIYGSEGQQRRQLSAPKLELTGAVRDSVYCSAANLRLTLQLSFHNTSSRPILLRKDGFPVGRYKVSRNEQQLRAGKYELNIAPMMNSVGILKHRLEDKVIDQSAFITLEPTATHTVLIQLNIPFIEESKQRSQDSLAPGDYLLQVLVWTWLDSQSFATQSREKWKDQGYLWTKSITSEPIPFTVTKERIISACS